MITFDVRWASDVEEMDAVNEVTVSCDDEATWTYAVYSLPAGFGNPGANSNVRKSGGNVEGDVTITFPEAVDNFAALGDFDYTMNAANTTVTFNGVNALQ